MKRQTACALALTFLISANGAMGMSHFNSAKTKVCSFYKDHKKEIKIIIGTTIVVGSVLGACWYLDSKKLSKSLISMKDLLKNETKSLTSMKDLLKNKTDKLSEMVSEKDVLQKEFEVLQRVLKNTATESDLLKIKI